MNATMIKDLTTKLKSDKKFRVIMICILSVALNLGFAAFNLFLYITTHSFWYGSMAIYYSLLGIVRIAVFIGEKLTTKRAGDDEKLLRSKIKVYRNCGAALVALELGLVAAVTQMVLSQDPSPNTNDIMAIGMAAYTFTKTIIAIINVVKARAQQDPIMQSLRNISLTDAAVSMLSLSTNLIFVFSEEGSDDWSMQVMTYILGFAVCALTLALGAIMIIGGTKRLKNNPIQKERKI